MWAAHTNHIIGRLLSPTTDRLPLTQRTLAYKPRHGDSFASQTARAIRAADLAERAVLVLASVESPESRECYRRLLRSGALPFTVDSILVGLT